MTPDTTENTTINWWVRAYIVVPLVASGVAVGLARIDPARISLGSVRYAGLGIVAAGLALVAWTVLTYSRTGETLSPVTRPDRLVTTGPLTWTRNPLYLGVVTAVAGVAVEEPKLAAAFGDVYHTYCDRVPRWLPRRPD